MPEPRSPIEQQPVHDARRSDARLTLPNAFPILRAERACGRQPIYAVLTHGVTSNKRGLQHTRLDCCEKQNRTVRAAAQNGNRHSVYTVINTRIVGIRDSGQLPQLVVRPPRPRRVDVSVVTRLSLRALHKRETIL